MKILRMMTLGGLEFLIVVVFAWALGPESWHIPLLVAAAAIVAVSALAVRGRYRSFSVERDANLAQQAGWAWTPALSTDSYRLRLVTALQLHGWHVNMSNIAEGGIVEIAARKDRCELVMVCINPLRAPTEGDVQRLAALRVQRGASHQVLVAEGADLLPAGPHQMQLRYADLEELDVAIGLNLDTRLYSK